MEIHEDAVIVGAGIAGLATALALKRVGVRALVLEKSHELRATGSALGLFQNAWLALEALGVAHKLTPVYAPLKKSYVTNVGNGDVQEVPITVVQGQGSTSESRAVHRKALLEALAEELPTDSIRFSSKLNSIKTYTHEGSSMAMIHMEDGTVIKAKILIGCDGVHSMVARWLGLANPVHSGRSAVRGLSVSPHGHEFKNEVHNFLDDGLRAGFVPLNDKEIYWFVTYTSSLGDEEMARDPELIRRNVIEKLVKNFPSKVIEVVQHTDLSTLTMAPLMLRFPWNLILGNVCKENVTVAGDAMHPMTPDLGQGGCAALEDAIVLGRHIGISFQQNGRIVPSEVAAVLERYAKERRWRAAGLIIGSFISGIVQHGTSGWVKIFRGTIFYKLLFRKILDILNYDCGKLP